MDGLVNITRYHSFGRLFVTGGFVSGACVYRKCGPAMVNAVYSTSYYTSVPGRQCVITPRLHSLVIAQHSIEAKINQLIPCVICINTSVE